MDDETRPAAPNYTSAFLWMALVNLLWILGLIWAVFGLPAVMAAGWLLDRVIQRFCRRA
ncbi:hypothetical protein GCM10011534_25530 [Pseudooceanicola nanhaiensis]|uniref:Histidinol phosphate aminotransferase n=1 Tax=Pseudooceanicola nanhaiensis TaxID=375761 RepID=A0A917SYN6_9RHOB|nr:hypothetical protein [Pseudooceanicola nanhaiensis]GGM02551.1 hypothetical protein GCM10011534_25530 [Pseudooceanicola nanhaiensis]